MARTTAGFGDQFFTPYNIATDGRRRIVDLFGFIEQVGRDRLDPGGVSRPILRRAFVLQVEDLGHLGRSPKSSGVTNPFERPVRLYLARRPSQIRTDIPDIRIPLDLMASLAAQRLDEMDPTVQLVRFRHFDHALVARTAGLLDVLRLVHRVIPVMHLVPAVEPLPPLLLGGVARGVCRVHERHSTVASDVTGRTAYTLHRMRRRARHEQVEVRVRCHDLRHPDSLVFLVVGLHVVGQHRVVERRRLPVDFETRTIDVHVTGVATIHLRYAYEVDVVLEIAQDDLTDLDRRVDKVDERSVAELILEGRLEVGQPALE